MLDGRGANNGDMGVPTSRWLPGESCYSCRVMQPRGARGFFVARDAESRLLMYDSCGAPPVGTLARVVSRSVAKISHEISDL